jgi:hypothetical protein
MFLCTNNIEEALKSKDSHLSSTTKDVYLSGLVLNCLLTNICNKKSQFPAAKRLSGNKMSTSIPSGIFRIYKVSTGQYMREMKAHM